MSKKTFLSLGFIFLLGLYFKSEISLLFTHFNDKHWIFHYLKTSGYKAQFLIFLSASLFLLVGGPKQAVAALFGYLYGIIDGSLFSVLACLTGAVINYYLALFIFNAKIHQNSASNIKWFYCFSHQNPFYKILLLRIFPLGSNLVTNSLSGAVALPLAPFLAASFIGYLPQVGMFAWLGDGINNSDPLVIQMSIALSLASILLTAVIYRKHIKHKIELPSQALITKTPS